MADLPANVDLAALLRQAEVGDGEDPRLAVAREHGFASWADLETEVERRAVLDALDVVRLRALLAARPELAASRVLHWRDHPRGATPLAYVAMLRYDTASGAWRDVPEAAALAEALLDAGARVEGDPEDAETPLITAASYGDAAVVRVLVAAGADLTAVASASAGGVPGGTALRHATVFGMASAADVLLEAGATDLLHAAATGGPLGPGLAAEPEPDRVAALRVAAGHGHLVVVDELLAAGTPVDGVDRDGSTALHEAAWSGRAHSARHLLARGADPARRDSRFGGTPLDWCRHRRQEVGSAHGHDEVEAVLGPVTPGG